MKKTHNNVVTSLFDKEITILLKEIAVEHGVKTPQTIEEVKIFEKTYASEIQAAKQSTPDLKSVLALAKKVNESDAPIANPIDQNHKGYGLLMAARNGDGITHETDSKLDAAILKKRMTQNDE